MAEAIGLRIGAAAFWDGADLRREVDRIFDVCNGCRLCFKLCGTFPAIFDGIDRRSEERREAHHPLRARAMQAALDAPTPLLAPGDAHPPYRH